MSSGTEPSRRRGSTTPHDDRHSLNLGGSEEDPGEILQDTPETVVQPGMYADGGYGWVVTAGMFRFHS